MPGHVRITDLCSGHGPCPPRINQISSPDTFVNNLMAIRFSDIRVLHCRHTGINLGIHDVFVNNLMSQVAGDEVSCGSTQVQASMDTIVN